MKKINFLLFCFLLFSIGIFGQNIDYSLPQNQVAAFLKSNVKIPYTARSEDLNVSIIATYYFYDDGNYTIKIDDIMGAEITAEANRVANLVPNSLLKQLRGNKKRLVLSIPFQNKYKFFYYKNGIKTEYLNKNGQLTDLKNAETAVKYSIDPDNELILSNADLYKVVRGNLELYEKDYILLTNQINNNEIINGLNLNNFENTHYLNKQPMFNVFSKNAEKYHKNGLVISNIIEFENDKHILSFDSTGKLLMAAIQYKKDGQFLEKNKIINYWVGNNGKINVINGTGPFDNFSNTSENIKHNLIDAFDNYQKGEYINGVKDGQWIGKINGYEFTEIFKKGEFIKGTVLETTGKVIKYSQEEENAFLGKSFQDISDYLSKNIIYPDIAVKNNITGKVFVNFTVEKDGSITDAKVTKSASPELDNEALRVVNKMPKWQPGKLHGVKVKSKFTLPINFQLAGN